MLKPEAVLTHFPQKPFGLNQKCKPCRDELEKVLKLVKPQHFQPAHTTHFQPAHTTPRRWKSERITLKSCNVLSHRDELEEVLKLVKPQHFLPVHGEFAFLCAHAQLASEVGCNFTSVIRNGQMLGIADRRNGKTLSLGWAQPQQEADSGTSACSSGGGTSALLCLSHVASLHEHTAHESNLTSGQMQMKCNAPAATAASPAQPEEDPFKPSSDRDAARAAAAVGVLGGQATGTLQLLGDVSLREFFNDGGKVGSTHLSAHACAKYVLALC